MIARMFGLEPRATLENPSMSLSDPSTWDEVLDGGRETDSGVRVTHTTSLSYAPVWQAVSLISGDVAKLPLSVYRRRPDLGEDAREKAGDHPAHRLVRKRPNAEVTAFTFWRRMLVHLLLWNRAYAWIERDRNMQPIGLYNLLPDRTAPARKDGQLYYVTEVGGSVGSPRTRTLWPFEVLALEGITTDNLEPVDLVIKARNSWALGLAAEKFGSKFFRHGARTSGILEVPLGMPKPAADKLEEGFRKEYSGEKNWFKTVILRDGSKFHQTSVKPEEGQMHELREDQVRDVCRWYNLPPSKLGLSDSVSYNSRSEDNQAYKDSTLDVPMTMITAECGAKLLSEREQEADSHYFEHNTNALLRMNTLERARAYAIFVRNRIMSRNEIRARENLNPVDGGDVFDPPRGGGGVATGENEGTGDNDGDGQQDGAATDDADRQRLAAIRRAVFSFGRAARHHAKSPHKFCDWIDGGWERHRNHYRTETGEEAGEFFDAAVSRLQRLAETTSERDLPAAVDEAISEFEAGH